MASEVEIEVDIEIENFLKHLVGYSRLPPSLTPFGCQHKPLTKSSPSPQNDKQ